ncbi:ferrochelatase [Rickettsiales bacterium]|nr:ferrochelatase [Rickettsiales bacterium]MDB2550239.1 ferrochelatase [Rickettsiales bacterium]
MNLPKNHPKISNNIGVLIINLGTPNNYDFFSVRKYLKEFLSDKRVIEVNPILWQIILNLFILTFRPGKTGKNYQKIWLHDKKMSPLLYYTKLQAEQLHNSLNKKNPNLIIDFAMRYGNPSIASKIKKLQNQKCRKIIFIPLYPQYASATTASINDKIYDIMQKIRYQPAIRIQHSYYDHDLYINALVNSVKKHLKILKFQPDAIISSYHGIPKEYFEKGDPYQCFCHKTNRLFSEKLQKDKIEIPNFIAFQSRFGPKEWLKPYMEDVLDDMIAKNYKKILVISPGFASDCIETLEEINIGYRELFLKKGGKDFDFIPCLNDNSDHIKLLEKLVKDNLTGF